MKPFAERLALLFASSQRIDARPTAEGLVLDCIWHGDLDAAWETIRGVEPDYPSWSEPRIEYRTEEVVANGRKRTLTLEPFLQVEVLMPEEFSGTVIGDLCSRRGMIEGMEERSEGKVIRAEVPLSELRGYSTFLESVTTGRAVATAVFSRWAEAPRGADPDDDEPMSAALRA